MPNASTNRIRHDALDLGDVTVRCSCESRGTLLVFSLSHYMKVGREAALAIASASCPRCSVKETRHAE